MIRRVFDWLEDRTGARKLAHSFLYQNIPGGARWRYVWGNAFLFALFLQAVTGVTMWFGYSPGAHSAWESVYYIQMHVHAGWFVRGLHHFNAQLLTVLLAARLAQIIVDGTYRAPREINFWICLLMLFVVLAASVTGWLLPWDQKGYWETKVATNILSITPIVGPALRRIAVGGSEFGHLTLTRFFALHAGVIPASLLALIVIHIYLFRRHGYAWRPPLRKPAAWWWPDQALRDATACFALICVLLALTLNHHGAQLAPPADPTDNYSAARPEWFFLPLYQFLKLFPGGTEVIGAIVIPGLFFTLIALMPFIARRRFGQIFNVATLVAAILVAAGLIVKAISADRYDPQFIAAKRQLQIDSVRIKVLARAQGIPPTGALTLLQNDPLTQGPRLFAKYCASCHRFDGQNGMGLPASDKQSASDLKDFGTRAWLAGLLDPARVTNINYFGGTTHTNGKMAKFVRTKVAAFTPEQKADLANVIMAVSAEAQLPGQRDIDERDVAAIKQGAALIPGAMR